MSQQASSATSTPPPLLLKGYDTVQHSERESVLMGDAYRESGSNDCQISVCDSLSEVANALEIHASLSVSYLTVASMSSSMDFMRNLKISTHNVVVVVRARRWSDVWKASNVRLKPSVTAPGTKEQAAAFAKSYGDSYVNSVTLGGDYCGVYVFRTESKSEQETLSASLRASGVYTGVSVEASVQTKLSKFLSSTNTTYTFDHQLRGVAAAAPASQDEMIAFARNFSALPLTDPAVLGFSVTGYEDVAGFGDAFYLVVDNREYFLGIPGGSQGLLYDKAVLQSVANQAQWLQSIYDAYHYEGDGLLMQFRDALQKDIEKIDAQIKSYRRAPATPLTRPALPALLQGAPALNVKKGPVVGWGGSGGDPWNFRPIRDVIKDRVKIKSIRIGGNKYVERIEIVYKGDTLSWSDIGGRNVPESEMRNTLNLEENDVITRLVVHAGEFVDNLFIQINGEGEHVQTGGSGGGRNEWKPTNGQFIVGFKGRLGGYVNQLQVVYASLAQATYEKH